MKKRILICVVCLVVAVAVCFGGAYLYDTLRYRRIIADIVITTPDISRIQDGTYNGYFDANFIAADVDVTVRDHRITAITINEHRTERGAKAEVITDDVIANQSLEVDTISGATNSSKVILKAIEIALVNGMR